MGPHNAPPAAVLQYPQLQCPRITLRDCLRRPFCAHLSSPVDVLVETIALGNNARMGRRESIETLAKDCPAIIPARLTQSTWYFISLLIKFRRVQKELKHRRGLARVRFCAPHKDRQRLPSGGTSSLVSM